MASEGPSSRLGGGDESAAQRLAQQHADHHATVEDVPDEDDNAAPTGSSSGPILSEKAAGKRKEEAGKPNTLDTGSEELFPTLGKAPKPTGATKQGVWGSGKPSTNGTTNGATNGTSRAASDAPAPTQFSIPKRDGPAPIMKIPGRNVEEVTLENRFVLPREKLRRPIPDIIKDINRKSRANITMSSSSGGNLKFEATGAPDVAQQALKDLISQISIKVSDSLHPFHPLLLTSL